MSDGGSALGGIALAVDVIQTKGQSKLKSVEPGSVDAYYMLAAYVFDLSRKLEYVYKASRQFALQADPALAAEIKKDNEALGALGANWKAVAEKAEEILLRLYREIAEEHEILLKLAAARRG